MVSQTTDRFNGYVASLAFKVPCQTVAVANITLSGSQIVNGIEVFTGDRVLVTAQTDPIENGIYLVTSSAWDRAPDFDGRRDATTHSLVLAARDGGQSAACYQIDTPTPFIIGEDEVNFSVYWDPDSGGTPHDLNSHTDVNITSPVNGQHLEYQSGNWVNATTTFLTDAPSDGSTYGRLDGAWSVVPTSFSGLPDTDLAGLLKYDMLWWDGTDWVPTAGQLSWNPDLDRLQLANAHSINWLNTSATSVELLQFEETGAAGVAMDYYVFEDLTGTNTTSQTYVVTAYAQDQSGMIDGDEYLVVSRAQMLNYNSQAADSNGYKLTVNGGDLSGSEQLYESLGGTQSATAGAPYGYVGWFTADTAGGNLRAEHKRGSGGIEHAIYAETHFVLNLTTDVPNHVKSSSLVETDIEGTGWTSTGTSIVLGAGDWLVYVGAIVSQFTGATKPSIGLDDGTNNIMLAGRAVEDSANDVLSFAGAYFLEDFAGGTIELIGTTNNAINGGITEYESIIAIPLSDFTEAYGSQNTSSSEQFLADEDVEEIIHTMNVPSIAGTGTNFIAIGFATTSWNGTSFSPFFEIVEDVNSGGDVLIGWDLLYGNRKDSAADAFESNNMFSAAQSYTVGDDVDIKLNSIMYSPSYATFGYRYPGVVLLRMQTPDTSEEKFYVGDPDYTTQIEGSLVSIGHEAATNDAILHLQTGGNLDSVLGWFETTAGQWGFSARQDGVTNKFEFRYHNDDAVGTLMYSINRGTNRFDWWNYTYFHDDIYMREAQRSYWFNQANDTSAFMYCAGVSPNAILYTVGTGNNWSVSAVSVMDFTGSTRLRYRSDTGGALVEHSYLTGTTDHDTNFVSTVDWDIRGLTGNVRIRDGAGLQWNDSTDVDTATFYHDDVDFNSDFIGTTDWVVTGITNFDVGGNVLSRSTAPGFRWVETGAPTTEGYWWMVADGGNLDLRAYDDSWSAFDRVFTVTRTADIVDSIEFFTDNNTSRVRIDTNGCSILSGRLDVENGSIFRVRNSADTDWADFSHDDTDFNTDFTNTADWNVTGARFVPEAITTPSEVVTATNVITAAESGKTYYLDAAGGFTSTLPAPALGLKYRFVVKTAPTTAYIITTDSGANVLYGTINEITTTAGISVQAQDTLNFVASTALIGDWIEVESDGTNWYVHGVTQVDDGITASVT